MITLSNICKQYKVGDQIVRALQGVSLTIHQNELVAITGASGSGKSTMMNILGCLDQPSSGCYSLDKIQIDSLDENAIATIRNTKLGFVFQSFHLLPKASALDNVMLPLVYGGIDPKTRKARAQRALDEVGLSDRMDHKPSELSGGQRQRVAIARALANEPTLILADEPTGNLDSETTEDILSLFEGLHADGQTIVMVTHESEVANRCNRVIKMTDGQIESDTLLANFEPRVKYYA